MSANALKSHNVVGLTVRVMSYGQDAIRALELADHAHEGQFRKECRVGVEYKDPYISHPIRNALRVARFTDGKLDRDTVQKLVVCSLLHDTVEDGADRILEFYGVEGGGDFRSDALNILRSEFGEGVADVVSRVTNPLSLSKLDKSRRNETYLNHLRKSVVNNELAYFTKASDLIDNAGSLKYMDANDKRRNLANKYAQPVSVMIHFANVIENVEVREAVRTRLENVGRELLWIILG